MFKDDDIVVVAAAVKELIKTLEFPPTVADVKRQMCKIMDTYNGEPTAIDEWNAIRQAIKSSIYYSVENFDKLPPVAKKFVGEPAQLKDWAMSEDFNDSIVRGQFLKQYDTLKERENGKYKELLGKIERIKLGNGEANE